MPLEFRRGGCIAWTKILDFKRIGCSSAGLTTVSFSDGGRSFRQAMCNELDRSWMPRSVPSELRMLDRYARVIVQ